MKRKSGVTIAFTFTSTFLAVWLFLINFPSIESVGMNALTEDENDYTRINPGIFEHEQALYQSFIS
jgi:hypothetical protein